MAAFCVMKYSENKKMKNFKFSAFFLSIQLWKALFLHPTVLLYQQLQQHLAAAKALCVLGKTHLLFYTVDN